MGKLCELGLFSLLIQDGIASTFQQTIHHLMPFGYYEWRNLFVQVFETLTNGMYWIIVVTILVYLFYLIFVRQVVSYLTNNKNSFKRLEVPPELLDPNPNGNVYAGYSNSATSFCSTDFEAAPFSGALVPSFTLRDFASGDFGYDEYDGCVWWCLPDVRSSEDAKHLRSSLRQVWSLSREPRTRPSALELLKKEIDQSRRLRHELESSLDQILSEHEQLGAELVGTGVGGRGGSGTGAGADRPDWKEQLRLERASLRERISTHTSSQERLTQAAVMDPRVIQHRLAASRSEIRELQLQIDELKTEKQSAIELVSKILFRGDGTGGGGRGHGLPTPRRFLPLTHNDSDPPCLGSAPAPDLFRNYSHADSHQRNLSFSSDSYPDWYQSPSQLRPLPRSGICQDSRNFSHPEQQSSNLGDYCGCTRRVQHLGPESYPDSFQLRHSSGADPKSVSTTERLVGNVFPDLLRKDEGPELRSQDTRVIPVPLAAAGEVDIGGQAQSQASFEPGHKSLDAEAKDAGRGLSGSHDSHPPENCVDGVGGGQHSSNSNPTDLKNKEDSEVTNESGRENGSKRCRSGPESDEQNTAEFGEGLAGSDTERPQDYAGPVTGSPLFHKFLSAYCKDAKSE